MRRSTKDFVAIQIPSVMCKDGKQTNQPYLNIGVKAKAGTAFHTYLTGLTLPEDLMCSRHHGLVTKSALGIWGVFNIIRGDP